MAELVILPIDAKFPVEDYQRLLQAADEGDREGVAEARSKLRTRFRNEGKSIAEYINVPEKCCFPIADSVSYETASLMEPLAVAYRGIGNAGDLDGKTVLIVGAGTIGLLAMACVKQ